MKSRNLKRNEQNAFRRTFSLDIKTSGHGQSITALTEVFQFLIVFTIKISNLRCYGSFGGFFTIPFKQQTNYWLLSLSKHK